MKRGFSLLREYVRRSGCKVFVPAAVRHEIEAKFVERLEKERKNLDSSAASISRLTEVSFKAPDFDVSAELEKYRLRLDSRFEKISVRILPYPPITHEAMVDRQLKDLMPFQPKGTGYRDALIWYSLLEELKKEDRDCVIVTNNTNDFSQHKDDSKTLHANFESDLNSSGIKAHVQVRRNLDEFINEFVKPTLKKLDEFKLELQKGQPVNLKEYLEEHFTEVFDGLQNVRLRLRTLGFRHLEEPIGVSSMSEGALGLSD